MPYLSRIIPVLVLALSLSTTVVAQNKQRYIDSLKNELVIHPARDTSRAIVLYRLCYEYSKLNIDSALNFGNEALRLSMELNFQKGIGASYNNIGLCYEKLGDDVKALKFYTLSLDAKRKNGDPRSIASTLNNIGIIYKKQEYYSKALEYYYEAISLNKASNNQEFLLINYYNVANCHKELHHSDSAMHYYHLSSALASANGEYFNLVNILHSMGNYYAQIGEYEKALMYFDSAVTVTTQHDLRKRTALDAEARGLVYMRKGQLDSAEKYLYNAWNEKQHTTDWGPVSNIAHLLSELQFEQFRQSGKTEFLLLSRQFLETSYSARDSLLNTRRLNTIFELVTDDMVRQKDAEITAIQREKDIVDLKADNERLFRNLVIAIALAVMLVLFVLWQRYKKNQQLNRKLAEQNVQIESKNKEIIDSITYAKRLQEAILPPSGYLKQFYPESFILYLPKDIVAGDFYWLSTSGDKFFIAAADCTGHGVPGAMVSVVCANALDRSVNEFGIRSTNMILDKTRSLVVQTFEKSAEMVNDGMDISLLALSLNPAEPIKAQWSGANNPLWIVRNGKLIEWKGDKQPVGRFENQQPFMAHTVELQPGDWIYLLTDGFADQFGGPKGKKFKNAALKQKLVEIHQLPAGQQHEQLLTTLRTWQGPHEQVDDICIVGVRV